MCKLGELGAPRHGMAPWFVDVLRCLARARSGHDIARVATVLEDGGAELVATLFSALLRAQRPLPEIDIESAGHATPGVRGGRSAVPFSEAEGFALCLPAATRSAHGAIEALDCAVDTLARLRALAGRAGDAADLTPTQPLAVVVEALELGDVDTAAARFVQLVRVASDELPSGGARLEGGPARSVAKLLSTARLFFGHEISREGDIHADRNQS